MILKIEATHNLGWVYIDNIAQLEGWIAVSPGKWEMPEDEDMGGVDFTLQVEVKKDKPVRIVTYFKRDGSFGEAQYTGCAYLLNDNGKTIERL